MVNWNITIQGCGSCLNPDHPGDADKLAGEIVQHLLDSGQDVQRAIFTSGETELVVFPRPLATGGEGEASDSSSSGDGTPSGPSESSSSASDPGSTGSSDPGSTGSSESGSTGSSDPDAPAESAPDKS